MKEIRETEQIQERIQWKVLLVTARCQKQNYKNGNRFNIGKKIKKNERIPHSKKKKKIRNNKKAFRCSTEHICEKNKASKKEKKQ